MVLSMRNAAATVKLDRERLGLGEGVPLSECTLDMNWSKRQAMVVHQGRPVLNAHDVFMEAARQQQPKPEPEEEAAAREKKPRLAEPVVLPPKRRDEKEEEPPPPEDER